MDRGKHWSEGRTAHKINMKTVECIKKQSVYMTVINVVHVALSSDSTQDKCSSNHKTLNYHQGEDSADHHELIESHRSTSSVTHVNNTLSRSKASLHRKSWN